MVLYKILFRCSFPFFFLGCAERPFGGSGTVRTHSPVWRRMPAIKEKRTPRVDVELPLPSSESQFVWRPRLESGLLTNSSTVALFHRALLHYVFLPILSSFKTPTLAHTYSVGSRLKLGLTLLLAVCLRAWLARARPASGMRSRGMCAGPSLLSDLCVLRVADRIRRIVSSLSRCRYLPLSPSHLLIFWIHSWLHMCAKRAWYSRVVGIIREFLYVWKIRDL